MHRMRRRPTLRSASCLTVPLLHVLLLLLLRRRRRRQSGRRSRCEPKAGRAGVELPLGGSPCLWLVEGCSGRGRRVCAHHVLRTGDARYVHRAAMRALHAHCADRAFVSRGDRSMLPWPACATAGLLAPVEPKSLALLALCIPCPLELTDQPPLLAADCLTVECRSVDGKEET